MIRTFPDAGVYIATWRGPEPEQSTVRRLFRDANRVLIASSAIRLELARNRHNSSAEIAHFEALFNLVQVWLPLDDDLAFRARELRTEYDLGALDALHIVAAEIGVAEQFVTTEKSGKPLYRVAHVGPAFFWRSLRTARAQFGQAKAWGAFAG